MVKSMTFNLSNWSSTNYENLIEYCKSNSDQKYLQFHQKLIPNVDNLLGIRVPLIKSIAKEIAKGNWQQYIPLVECRYYEETMLNGLVIGNIKANLDIVLPLIKAFIPKIDNWAVCDSFCASLKITNKYKNEMFEFLQEYLQSNEEFKLRFAVVMLMDYYIDDENIDQLLNIFNNVKHDGYYVKMAVAWALSFCFIKQREKTLTFFQHNNLDNFTYQKALQKTVESNRVCDEDKLLIRQMKKQSNYK